MKRVAFALAFVIAASTPALARGGGAHGGGLHAATMGRVGAPGGSGITRAPAVAAPAIPAATTAPATTAPTTASSKSSSTLGGPWPSSTAPGGAPNPNAPFNPSGVGVPGGSGPGNTTVIPNTTPPPVSAGTLGNGMVNYPSSLSTPPSSSATPPNVTPAQ
jgi:hypothetical protein